MNTSMVIQRTLCIVAFGFVLTACGGKQSTAEEPVIVEEQPSCISERWARPPEQIGETPPEAFPSGQAIEPFRSSRSTPDSSSPRHDETTSGANDDERESPEADESENTPPSADESTSSTPESSE